MEKRTLSFKEGAIAFLVAFLLSQLLIFAGQLVVSGILATQGYTQSQMANFLQSAPGTLITQACQCASFVAIFLYFFKTTSLKHDCKNLKTSPKLYAMFIGLGLITMFALTNLINYFTLFLNLNGTASSIIGYTIKDTSNYLLSILSLAVLPAIGEELMFRGVLYNAFGKKNKLLGILLSSLSFALFHFNLSQLVYPFLFGLLLSIAYAYTENILVPISIHFANNFVNLTMQYASNSNSFGLSSNIILWTIIGIIVFIGLLSLLFILLSKKEKQENQEETHSQEKPKKQNTHYSKIGSAIGFMRSDGFIVTICFSIMLAFYIGIVF